MIDTAKIRIETHRDTPNTRTIQNTLRLCDEVDRISKLYGDVCNARVVAENLCSSFCDTIEQLKAKTARKEEQIQVLLDALVSLGKESERR